MTRKLLTLTIVHQGERVLLGMKKRGFGAGRYNGFGGKVEANESIEEAATREVIEEAHIKPLQLQKLGVMEFTFESDPDLLEVHIFKSTAYEGEVGESEEMYPSWFHYSEIPFEAMWRDDRFWFPLLLRNKKFMGRVLFDTRHEIIHHELQEVTKLP
jgi:8-oxo-dGTP diphosphatase / 2-hydroxy-dATP diphosphatase